MLEQACECRATIVLSRLGKEGYALSYVYCRVRCDSNPDLEAQEDGKSATRNR